MHLICPLIIQILLASAYGGDVSKVPSIRAINWSIVKFAFQQLEGGVTGVIQLYIRVSVVLS